MKSGFSKRILVGMTLSNSGGFLSLEASGFGEREWATLTSGKGSGQTGSKTWNS
jgi:hypothetical protein